MSGRAFRSLSEAVEAHYHDLVAFVRRRTGSAALAADVVQETWIRAATSDAAVPDNARAYLYRMAGNVAVDQLRRAGGRTPRQIDHELPVDLACPAPAPDRVVESRQELTILVAAVQELPPKCRQVFLLYRGHGLSMRQVAHRLGISEKTVEKHIARAMVHCRQRLRAAGREV